MQALPRAARLYLLAVFILGGTIALVSLLEIWGDWSLLLSAALLAGVIAVLDLYPVKFPVPSVETSYVEFTVSTAARIAAVLLLPAPVVVLACFLGTAIAEFRLRRVWYKLLFNASAFAILYLLACFVYQVLHQPGVPLLQSGQNILMLIGVGLIDLTFNPLLISLVIALTVNVRVLQVWGANFRPMVLHDLSMLPLGVSIAILYQMAPWGVLLAIIPLIVVRSSYQAVITLRAQTRDALVALARVLDERDEATSHHCELVAQYATTTAREMGLSPEDVETVSLAAWLHDIGKVGMNNQVLYKAGALTSDEREHARRHASIGGDLLQKFPMFDKGAVIVRHHHEFFNGQGYPDGLKGEAIPLGARILAVADAFQAMTDTRPYRKALSFEAAMEELRRNAGTQFDPRVVDAFLRAQGAAPLLAPPKPKEPMKADKAVSPA